MRCWMLQDMDHREASCVFYVEVGTLNQFEQSKICVLPVTMFGIAMLTIHHNMIISVCFIQDPGGFLSQTTADVLSDKEWTVFITQKRDLGGQSPWLVIPANRHTTSGWLGANRMLVGNPCNRQLCATGFILCRTGMLPVMHAILTWI